MFNESGLVVRVVHKMAADVSLISPVVEEVIRVAKELGCAEGHEFEIDLALREALANAIRHGGANDPSKEIECCIACDRDRGMLIVVRDPGPGFDPATLPSPVLGENVFSTHGRGIYLINQLMDEVRFEKGGTEIHMVKRLKKPARRKSKSRPG
jgi:serine/threonine-protein kinase RsbW